VPLPFSRARGLPFPSRSVQLSEDCHSGTLQFMAGAALPVLYNYLIPGTAIPVPYNYLIPGIAIPVPHNYPGDCHSDTIRYGTVPAMPYNYPGNCHSSTVPLSGGLPFQYRTIIPGTAIPVSYNYLIPGIAIPVLHNYPAIAMPVVCNCPRECHSDLVQLSRGLPLGYCTTIAGILIPVLYTCTCPGDCHSPAGIAIPVLYNYPAECHSHSSAAQVSLGLPFPYCTIIRWIAIPVLLGAGIWSLAQTHLLPAGCWCWCRCWCW
jgi:hypothetical protein